MFQYSWFKVKLYYARYASGTKPRSIPEYVPSSCTRMTCQNVILTFHPLCDSISALCASPRDGMGFFDLGFSASLFRSQKAAIRPDGERVNIPSCPPQTLNNIERHSPRKGSIVFGYPSAGGILVRAVGPVELIHLGLERFKDAQRSPNAHEEEEFCRRLARLGPQWWASKAEMTDAQLGEGGETAEKKLAKQVETGWPSLTHGVWVLEYDLEDRAHYELRMGASLLANCLNMDERCPIIQELGGAFYPNPDHCEALRPLPH